MTATDQAAALTRTYSIGKRRRVTFTSPAPRRGAVLHMVAEWEPDVPDRLTAREENDYRAARADFTAALVQLMEADR